MKTEERKRPVLIGRIVLAVLLATGITFGCLWLFHWSRFVGTDDAVIDGNHAAISSKMLGRIKRLVVNEHQKVAAGQLLVQLDDTDLRAQETQMTASVNLSRQSLELARINMARAANDLERVNIQFAVAAATKEDLDHSQKSAEAARAQYSIAQAQVGIAQSQLEVVRTQLQNTMITAPFEGVITKRSVMPGEVVQPGQAIFQLYDLSDIWVTANLEETKVGRIHEGQPVEVWVDAYPRRPLKGLVAQVAANIVPPPFTIGDFTKTTQRVPVKILLDQRPDSMLLLPGMSVEVKLRIK
jgi:membrane fusion protein, multidrug efflux system